MFGSLFRAFHFLTDRLVSLAATIEECERVLTGQIEEAKSRLAQLPAATEEAADTNGIGKHPKQKAKAGA